METENSNSYRLELKKWNVKNDGTDAVNTSKGLLSAATQIPFFGEVDVPMGASYARVVLHQSIVPSSAGCTLNIRVPEFARNTHIEKCNLHHCRRQGISICGAKLLNINQSNIHHIGGSEYHTGTDPQAGIDIEDGYDLNQFIYIEDNHLYDNYGYDIVVVNGKEINIAKNKLSRVKKYVSLGIGDGVDRATVTQNSFYNALFLISGETIFSQNYVYGSRMQILGKYHKPINISNSVFYNSVVAVDNPFSYNVRIEGCRFFNDSDKVTVYYGQHNWTLEFKNEPQIFSNCTFEGKDVNYLTKVYTNKGGWIFENVTFKDVIGIELPGGNYNSCKFLNIDILRLTTNLADDVKFIDCNIMSIDIYNTLLTVNNLKSFSMINCYIEKPNSHILNIQNVTADVSIKNTTIKMKADTLNRAIIVVGENFNGLMILVEGNVFFASKNQLVVENLMKQGSLFIIRNNILTGVSLKNSNKELLGENIINGVIDPYYNMTTEPVTGFYDKGQQIRNLNPDRGGYIGWVCIRTGYANNQAWVASKYYKKGDRINVNDQVYEAMNNGVSNTSSPFLASEEIVVDNDINWRHIGQLAVFKTYGEISK